MTIPSLRFREFEEAGIEKVLSRYRFDEIFNFSSGKNIKQDEASPKFKTPCVRYGELYHLYGEVILEVINRTNLPPNELVFSNGDEILLPSAGEDPMDIGLASALTIENVAIGRTINVLRPKSEGVYSQIFVAYYINSVLRKQISTLARGASISNVYNSDLKKLFITIPSLPEQKKIASFLGAVDAKIAALRAKVSGLEAYKRGLMQALFTQRLRFTKPDGTAFPDWEEKKLGEVFVEIKDRVGDMNLPTYSISAGRGFVSQEERFGKDISGQQNERYTELKAGDFSYNKGNSISYKYGCIYENRTGSAIAVPNVFISFRLRNKKMSTIYFGKLFEDHYLDKGLRTLISSGARMNGLLNVNKELFFKLTIPVPHPDEQAKIADALSALDAKIQAVGAQVTHMETFKKGLLQQMFV